MSHLSFAEGDGAWGEMPAWVASFLRFGYSWFSESGRRRIGLISTPCDSQAAGLIALGAMRRRMEHAEAYDEARHYGRLLDLGAQGGDRCVIRNRTLSWRFLAELDARTGMLWARRLDARGAVERRAILEHHARDWYVDGEAAIEVIEGQQLPYGSVLSGIVDDGHDIASSALRRSDAAISLAGRVTGEAETRRLLAELRFRDASESADLSQLLCVHEWHPGLISRVTFYNARTRAMDRAADPPQAVIVDGGIALLRVLDNDQFRGSDTVAVIPRVSDRHELEDVAQRLANLAQWYADDREFADVLPGLPAGVTLRVLCRRS